MASRPRSSDAASPRLSCSALAQPSTAPMGVRRAWERLEMNSSLRRKVRATCSAVDSGAASAALSSRRRQSRPTPQPGERDRLREALEAPSVGELEQVVRLLRRRLHRFEPGGRRRGLAAAGRQAPGEGRCLEPAQLRRGEPEQGQEAPVGGLGPAGGVGQQQGIGARLERGLEQRPGPSEGAGGRIGFRAHLRRSSEEGGFMGRGRRRPKKRSREHTRSASGRWYIWCESLFAVAIRLSLIETP